MQHSSIVSSHSQTVTLPAAPEHDWRFSYQFAPPRLPMVARLVLGGSVLGLMIVVANVAW